MKIPAEFLPKSWEMPPSARVIEDSVYVVARNFSGKTLKWIVALIKIPEAGNSILWTRPLSPEFDAGFVAIQYSHRRIIPLFGNFEESVLGTTLTNFWQSNQLARYFFCNEKGALLNEGELVQDALLIAPNGIAAWTKSGFQNGPHSIAFDWRIPATNSEFLQLSSLELWDQMQNSLDNPDSESFRARQFANLDDEGRHHFIWGNSCLSEQEMRKLVRMLIVGQNFWTENTDVMEVNIDFNTGQEEVEIWVEQGNNYEMLEVTAELFEDAQLLANQFRTQLISDVNVQSNSYIEIWASGRTIDFEFIVPRPTAHEQLEAQLRWREWKRNHEKI